jgi:hypothetical protein
MARAGLTVDTQTLWDQLLALTHHLTPTYEALCADVRTAAVLGADETTWQLMEPGRSKTWWVWALCRADAVVYRLLDTRSADGATQVLGDYHGIVLCDGYAAYRALAKRTTGERAGPTITLAHCWAHVRRQYVEAEPSAPQAAEVLTLIGDLYAAERVAQETAAGDPGVPLAERRARAAPVVDAIRRWITEQRALPQSALGKALAYTTELWPGLVAFFDHAALPVDNNATERALRGIALGPQESLRLALGARHPRGGPLLHAPRLGEARRRRTGGVPRRGDAPGGRDAGDRHAAARPRWRVAFLTFTGWAVDLSMAPKRRATASTYVGNARQSNLLLDPSGRCLGTLALPQLEGCNGENWDDRNLWDEFVHSVRSVRQFSFDPRMWKRPGSRA